MHPWASAAIAQDASPPKTRRSDMFPTADGVCRVRVSGLGLSLCYTLVP